MSGMAGLRRHEIVAIIVLAVGIGTGADVGAAEGPRMEEIAMRRVTEVGLGGGGPGLSAELEASDGWVVIVLANLDPPSATHVAQRVAGAL